MLLRTDWHVNYPGYVILVNLFKLCQVIKYIKKSEIIWIRIYNRIIHEILITFGPMKKMAALFKFQHWFLWVCAMTAPVKDDSCQSDSYLEDVQSKRLRVVFENKICSLLISCGI